MDVPKGSIVVFSDIACPWATIAVYRLHEARARLGLDNDVALELRCFPLELFNDRPTPKRVLDAELPVAGALEPRFGWKIWQRNQFEWPVTTLPALEAVRASRWQGARAAEELDLALRKALFCDSRTISMHHEILEVAGACPAVDETSLSGALREGRARSLVFDDKELAEKGDVEGSPHLFFPDGTDIHNPGVQLHWEGDHGAGFPVVDKDDPGIFEDLLRRAT